MLTATELDSLIKTCAAHQVTQFRAGDVCITFSGFKPAVPAAEPSPYEQLAAADRAWMDLAPEPTRFSDAPADEAE